MCAQARSVCFPSVTYRGWQCSARARHNKVLAELDHPAIVKLYEYADDPVQKRRLERDLPFHAVVPLGIPALA